MTQKESTSSTQKEIKTGINYEYNHDFEKVEITDETQDKLIVEINIRGEKYVCPVPICCGSEKKLEMVYAHNDELHATYVGGEEVDEAVISGAGIEEWRNETSQPESIGAEVLYDSRPSKVQRARAVDSSNLKRYRTESGETLYCLSEDYIDSEWAGEDGVVDDAVVATIDIGEGQHTVSVGIDDVAVSYTLTSALEIAEEELKERTG